MRIKNLDTGEEFDLEDYGTHAAPPASAPHGGTGEAESAGAPDDDEELRARGVSSKRKAWLKSTKKLKTWAKTTLTNVKEKIEERIEKQQHQRQLTQQQHQHQLPVQEKQDSRLSGGFGGRGRGSDGGGPGHQRKDGEPADVSGPLELGALEGDVAEEGAVALPGALLASGLEACVGDGSSYGRAASQDGSVASTSTSSAAAPPGSGLGAAGTTKVGRDGSGAAAVRAAGEVPPLAGESAFAAASRGNVGFSPLTAAWAKASAASAAAAVAGSVPADMARGSATSNARGSGGAKPQVPPLPPLRALPVSQPLGAAAAPEAPPMAAASGAGAAGAGPAASSAALSAVGAGLAEGAAAAMHQYSEEMRTPLLEEDQAGPSSRAVPTAKSWLNQPARVVGGRRAAGRQLQQVRMVQELLAHEGPVWAVKFSADARLLASAGRDGVVRVWAVYWYGSGRSKLISPARDEIVPPGGPPASAAASGGGAATAASASGASFTSSASALASGAPRPPLLSESPLLFLPGHRSDVLDLSWSQCRLLLTASADQTARLWCIDVPPVGAGGGGPGGGGSGGGGGGGRRFSGAGSGTEGLGGGRAGGGMAGPSGECLRSFVHPDFVTSCSFHTTDPRRVVTGCADGKIRVWSVPDASVVATATVQQDLITRVLFSADGSRVVAGTLRGKARYYEFSGGSAGGGGTGPGGGPGGGGGGGGPGGGGVGGGGGALDYLTQLDVKNPHGSGRKVTGLVQVPYTYGNDQLYVITSADSRIRLYVGYTQERKFKGHRHTNTQIAASLSPSCEHLVCGSDDGWVYVWETGLPPPPLPGPGPGAALAAAVAGAPLASARGKAGGAAKDASSAAAALLRGGGGSGSSKVKENNYEAFQTPEQTTTVAIIAPNVCRLGRGLERLASMGPGQLSLLGSLLVVAGFSGKIYVYENLPAQGA